MQKNNGGDRMFRMLKVDIKENIAFLTVNKPEVLNALDADVLEELDRAIDDVQKNKEIKVVIITGEGRAFVAGADIAAQSVLDIDGGRDWGRTGSRIFRKLELLSVPTIAAVNGFALGGGMELAMACDLRIASSKAKFGQPEVSLGIIPGFSGTLRLPRIVGKAKAMELILTGDIIKADEALRIGLVNQIAEPEQLIEESVNLARRIIKNGTIAIKYAKTVINKGLDMDLDSGIALENEVFAMCFTTDDQKEGMTAFLEKREAKFNGK